MNETNGNVSRNATGRIFFHALLLKQWLPMMSGTSSGIQPKKKIVFLCLMTVMFTREQRDVNNHRPATRKSTTPFSQKYSVNQFNGQTFNRHFARSLNELNLRHFEIEKFDELNFLKILKIENNFFKNSEN